MTWEDLPFWTSGEWQVVEERLDDLDQTGTHYCPDRENIFAALDATPFEHVRVVILGQDPYPSDRHACGLAFSVPERVRVHPPSLVSILTEYGDDLHYPQPSSGDLTPWCKAGVLLWNAYPTCLLGKAGSHHWPEWAELTKEILTALDEQERSVALVCLGVRAFEFAKYMSNSPVLRFGHPSPLNRSNPFSGCRMFSTVNAKLREVGEPVINWRL